MLRERGTDVTAVSETARGLSDQEILEMAYREGRIVVTFDKDFGELAFRSKRPTKGLILLRFVPRSQISSNFTNRPKGRRFILGETSSVTL